jgi:hypothetical protein
MALEVGRAHIGQEVAVGSGVVAVEGLDGRPRQSEVGKRRNGKDRRRQRVACVAQREHQRQSQAAAGRLPRDEDRAGGNAACQQRTIGHHGVVDGGRVRMLRRETVVDGVADALDSRGQPAGILQRAFCRADHVAAAMEMQQDIAVRRIRRRHAPCLDVAELFLDGGNAIGQWKIRSQEAVVGLA